MDEIDTDFTFDLSERAALFAHPMVALVTFDAGACAAWPWTPVFIADELGVLAQAAPTPFVALSLALLWMYFLCAYSGRFIVVGAVGVVSHLHVHAPSDES